MGAAGVVGRCVHARLKDEHDIITAGLAGADLVFDLADTAAVVRALNDIGPLDAVISTAGRASFVRLEAVQPDALAASAYGLGLTDKLLGQVNLALAARAVLRPGGSITLTSGTTSDDPIIGGSSLSMVNGALEIGRASCRERV